MSHAPMICPFCRQSYIPDKPRKTAGKQETYLDMAFNRVKNTCWVWREDGPLVKEWKEKAKN